MPGNHRENQAVLFDLDGTLVDTAADFIKILNSMRIEDKLEPLSETMIRNTVSDGARALVKLAYALEEDDKAFEQQRQRLLDNYARELGNAAALFAGFDTLLDRLEQADIPWGIVTNKPERFTLPLLEKLQLLNRSAATICPDHVSRTKPDPEPLILAANKMNILPENCIYVGDHARDIEAGQNANMHTVACAYGYINDKDSIHDWGAHHVVNDTAELEHYLLNHMGVS